MNKTFYQSFLDKTYQPEGLPSDYPIPEKEDLLFYIQRNQNFNTVVYEVNRTCCGDINVNEPMRVYWIKYNDHREECELNYIQTKLAYGYKANVINNDLIEFAFVSYDKKFFIERCEEGHRVMTKINGVYSILENIYVYAEEYGVFPDVKFIELYGIDVESEMPIFERFVP
jgi:Domain of unknown function (DUF4833)